MQIVEIRGYWLESAMAKPVYNSVGGISVRTALLIELVDASGLSGWGETQRQPAEVWEFIETAAARDILGSHTFEAMTGRMSRLAQRGELESMAASAVDIALWDLHGREQGVPVATLLGGARRDRIRAYASGPFMSPHADPYDTMLADAESYLAQGFTAMKLRCGVTPDEDAAIVGAMRNLVGPTVELAIDLNTGYTPRAAREVAALCAPSGLRWIEEPLPPYDFDGYAALARESAVTVAAGESLWRAADFGRLLREGSVSVIQPDLFLCGGITGALAIAALAAGAGVPYLPHVFGSSVNFDASLQLAAVLPDDALGYPWFEYDRAENALRIEHPLDAGGTLEIPVIPGIGAAPEPAWLDGFTRAQWCAQL